MGAMNRQMNMPALQKIMRDFEMQNERMEMTSDVMGDAIDDAFEVQGWGMQGLGMRLSPKCPTAGMCMAARNLAAGTSTGGA
jgi:Snf7